jgi:hypothetical protein
MECMEGVVGRHVGNRVFVKTPGLGVTSSVIFEITQSLEGLCLQGSGFLPFKEVCMKHAPGLLSSLGLSAFLYMLPHQGGAKELV